MMADMAMVSVAFTLDRVPSDADSFAIGRRASGDRLLAVHTYNAHYGVTATGGDGGVAALARHQDAVAAALAAAGYRVVRLESAEYLTDEEADRRLDAASMPQLVDVKGFAALCGVSVQRIYELETARRTAAKAGVPHPFPTPLVRGWWLQPAAEVYAANRRTKPGPAPKHPREQAAAEPGPAPVTRVQKGQNRTNP